MAIKLVVFDMAGTTVEDNQNVTHVLMTALRMFGYDVKISDVDTVMGYPKPEAIRMLLQQYAGGEVAADKQLISDIHDRFVAEMKSFYKNNDNISAKDGAKEVFHALRQFGVKVGLDTGFSREIADVVFERLGWEEGKHFDISITSDEVANGRPYPDMIYKAMQLLGIDDINEVAKVGDTASDMQEGNAAGCKYVIGITTGSYTQEELQKEKHTHLIERLDEVLDIVLETELELD
jgi:phosphonatase-like hydrolase